MDSSYCSFVIINIIPSFVPRVWDPCSGSGIFFWIFFSCYQTVWGVSCWVRVWDLSNFFACSSWVMCWRSLSMHGTGKLPMVHPMCICHLWLSLAIYDWARRGSNFHELVMLSAAAFAKFSTYIFPSPKLQNSPTTNRQNPFFKMPNHKRLVRKVRWENEELQRRLHTIMGKLLIWCCTIDVAIYYPHLYLNFYLDIPWGVNVIVETWTAVRKLWMSYDVD